MFVVRVSCTLGHAAAVHALLRAADRKKRGDGPQSASMRSSWISSMRALVGASDADGLTPLMCAVWQGHVRCTELLLSYGAKNDPDGDGLTPLSVVTDREVQRVLIQAFAPQPGDDADVSDASDRRSPRSNGMSPRSNGQSPRSVGKSPRSVGKSPRSVGMSPRSVGKSPRSEPRAAPKSVAESATDVAPLESVKHSGKLKVREGALRKHWVQRWCTLANGELSCFADAKSAQAGGEPLWFLTIDERYCICLSARYLVLR